MQTNIINFWKIENFDFPKITFSGIKFWIPDFSLRPNETIQVAKKNIKIRLATGWTWNVGERLWIIQFAFKPCWYIISRLYPGVVWGKTFHFIHFVISRSKVDFKKLHFGKSGYQRISFFGLTRRDRADFEKSKIWFSKIENPDLDKIFLILFVGGNCKLRMNASWLVWMLPNRVLPAQSRSN